MGKISKTSGESLVGGEEEVNDEGRTQGDLAYRNTLFLHSAGEYTDVHFYYFSFFMFFIFFKPYFIEKTKIFKVKGLWPTSEMVIILKIPWRPK